MIFGNGWQQEKPTPSQLHYIEMLMKDNPNLPVFKGTTKGEASDYIRKNKKRK